MLEFLQQSKPTAGPALEELSHTAAMPWLVTKVSEPADYSDILESDICLVSLEDYTTDTWGCLETCQLFEPQEVRRIQDDLTYDESHVCFYPVALLSHEQPLQPVLATSSSAAERSQLDEKTLTELAEGRLRVSSQARKAMGDGYTSFLTAERGVSLLALMEIALSDHVRLLGWGWTWHRKA